MIKRDVFQKSAILKFLTDTLFFAFGAFFYAAGINFFAVPNSIAQSGAAGIAIVLNHLFGFPVGIANFAVNIPLFILAWIFLGKKFVLRTLWVVVLFSAGLDLTSLIPLRYSGDHILASLFCGVLTGIGLALCMVRGATSGGTDIAGKLVQKFRPEVSIGSAIAFANVLVVSIGAITFRSVESAMYAAVSIFISGKVVDYIVYGVGKGKMLMVVTEKPQEVSQAIIKQVGRGVSILPATGAYTGESKSMLVVAIHRSDLSKIYKVLKTVDDRAFTIVTEAGEIFGQGFKRNMDDIN